MDHAVVAAHIQLTNVRPNATRSEIERLIADCLDHRFHAAVVSPIWVPLAKARLAGTKVRVGTMLDFPMGGLTTDSVAAAAAEVRAAGADDVDVMTKVGWLKSGMVREYREHLSRVAEAFEGGTVRALMELDQLWGDEVETAIDAIADSGVPYVVNSSGYGGGAADPAKVGVLLRMASGRLRVKAAGGIRDVNGAISLLEAGAHLLGVFDGVPAGLVVESPQWRQPAPVPHPAQYPPQQPYPVPQQHHAEPVAPYPPQQPYQTGEHQGQPQPVYPEPHPGPGVPEAPMPGPRPDEPSRQEHDDGLPPPPPFAPPSR